jgi:hypothetical protein
VGLFDRWLKPVSREVEKTQVLFEAIEIHSRNCFYGEVASLAQLQPETKQAFINDLQKRAEEILAADDPFLNMRQELADQVAGYAEVTVLSLTESEKKHGPDANECAVSGTLHHHIQELWKHCNAMSDGPWRGKDEYDYKQLLALANFHGALAVYFVNGLKIIRRIHFHDEIKEHDWLGPFRRSMLILQEDRYRSAIGLPSLLEKEGDVSAHWTFLNFVIGGHKDPYFAWKENLQSAVALGAVSESVIS